MSLSYVIISNTGAIGGGTRFPVKYDTWRPSRPADETFVGLNGDAMQNIGAAATKWVWQFTLYATRGTLAQLEIYAKSTTAANRLLQFQDVDGVVWNAIWDGAYQPIMTASGLNDPNELFEVTAKVLQR